MKMDAESKARLMELLVGVAATSGTPDAIGACSKVEEFFDAMVVRLGNSPEAWPSDRFKFGDRVRKIRGSQWQGKVRGWYSTAGTPIGWAVESEREKGSVQVWPDAALEPVPDES